MNGTGNTPDAENPTIDTVNTPPPPAILPAPPARGRFKYCKKCYHDYGSRYAIKKLQISGGKLREVLVKAVNGPVPRSFWVCDKEFHESERH